MPPVMNQNPSVPPPLPQRLAPVARREDAPKRVTPVGGAPTGFLPRLVRETEREIRKPRVPMARIFVAMMAFGLSRLVR